MTLPQLEYYLKKCHKHIEFTINISTMRLSSILGVPTDSNGETTVNENGKEVVDGYEVADAEDMEWLASIL